MEAFKGAIRMFTHSACCKQNLLFWTQCLFVQNDFARFWNVLLELKHVIYEKRSLEYFYIIDVFPILIKIP